jgi:hypothetical protein
MIGVGSQYLMVKLFGFRQTTRSMVLQSIFYGRGMSYGQRLLSGE